MVDSLLVGLFLASLVLIIILRFLVERISHHHYQQKSDFYAHHPPSTSDIVFVGDSITDGANWHELFPGLQVKGRGINNDNTLGVLNRIDATLVGHPKAVFLLIGTNDLPLFEYRTNSNILATYEEILKKCHADSPETKIFVQSILPRKKGFAKRIRGLNAALKALAESYGYTFIDLFDHFATPEGQLRDAFTNDHLHLMSAGYDAWVKVITPYIESLTR
ncbi:MAG: GDSL-type esterase/lipase family protein [Anaerolineaceae bacterium]|jgi:lysophospholipase L1-like esterase